MKKTLNVKDKLKDFICMTLGSFMIAVGVSLFKVPNGFAIGGVSGIATILGKVIPFLSPAELIMIMNVVLLLVGFIVLGKGTGAKTVYCSLAFSGFSWILEKFVPMSAPMTNQPFLELAYAILLTGIGSAMLFHVDASSGGTDIVALILKKYTSLNVGRALLYTDFLVALTSFFVFGLETGLFSLLGLFAKAFLVDSIIENLLVCKSFMIITTKPEPIVDYILNTMHHSATTVDARGEFSQQNRKMIYTLCRRVEAAKLKKKLLEMDPDAFVIVQSTSEMIGRGFRGV